MEYRLLRTPFYRMIFIRVSVFYSYFYIDINTTLLSFQIFIESSVRYLHVGLQNEESDTESKEAKDSPTDEAQIKQEQFHLVAFHHCHTSFNGSIVTQFRFVFQNIVRHRIRIMLNDTRNQQQL